MGACTSSEVTSLQHSIRAGDCTGLTRLLQCRPALLNSSAWLLASKTGNADVFEALVNHALSTASSFGSLTHARRQHKLKAMLNERDALARTPLMYACMHGHSEVAAMLIKAGADPFKADRVGGTALHFAATHGHADCIRAVMSHLPSEQARKGRHNLQDKPSMWGSTPLHAAVARNQPECVEALLASGAMPMPRLRTVTLNDRGLPVACELTPLHMAAEAGFLSVARALLKHQASASRTERDLRRARDCDGRIPYDLARRKRRARELVELLYPTTDLTSVFGLQELATSRVVCVPKLSVLAAAALQSKLMRDITAAAKTSSLAAASQLLPEPPSPGPTGLTPATTSSLSMQPASSLEDDGMCMLCFEHPPVLAIAGCSHSVCCACASEMCSRTSTQPLTCPFCRREVSAFAFSMPCAMPLLSSA